MARVVHSWKSPEAAAARGSELWGAAWPAAAAAVLRVCEQYEAAEARRAAALAYPLLKRLVTPVRDLAALATKLPGGSRVGHHETPPLGDYFRPFSVAIDLMEMLPDLIEARDVARQAGGSASKPLRVVVLDAVRSLAPAEERGAALAYLAIATGIDKPASGAAAFHNQNAARWKTLLRAPNRVKAKRRRAKKRRKAQRRSTKKR